MLALEDDRIGQCYKLRKTGTKAAELTRLKKEVMADGFSDAVVTRAINRYEALTMEKEETEQTEKDLDKQLESEMYTAKDMYNYIRNGTGGDVGDVVEYRINVSTAQNPRESVTSAIKSEFKAEYIELAMNGKAAQAESLGKNLIAAGLTRGDLDGWLKDEYWEKMNAAIEGNDLKSAIKNGLSAQEYGKTGSSVKERLKAGFKEEYVQLVIDGKSEQASAMAKQLSQGGVGQDDMTAWEEDGYKKRMKEAISSGDANAAEETINILMDEYGKTGDSIKSTLNSEFKQTYIDFVMSGEYNQAEELAENLQGLGLRNNSGENYFRGEILNGWVRDWEKKQEEND